MLARAPRPPRRPGAARQLRRGQNVLTFARALVEERATFDRKDPRKHGDSRVCSGSAHARTMAYFAKAEELRDAGDYYGARRNEDSSFLAVREALRAAAPALC